MTLEDFYLMVGGDYEDALRRLTTPERIQKMLNIFVHENMIKRLSEDLEAGDVNAAFRDAHTMKGNCLTLSLIRFLSVVSSITEALRSGNLDLANELFPDVEAEYTMIVGAIGQVNT